MSIELKFIEKSVYGNILFYPANTESMAITTISKRATFTIKELRILKDAGFFIIIERESTTL